jgi:hypothetical protein
LSLALRARDLIAGGVLFTLETLELGDQPASARFERGELLELGVRRNATVPQARADLLEVFSQIRRIEHASDPIPTGRVLRYDVRDENATA